MGTQPADVLLFIAPGCPHCPVVLQGLTELVKEGGIGTLEVVNVAVHPERAAELGVRTAPWTRIGPFVLQGSRSPKELREWAIRAGSGEGGTAYLRELLASGRLKEAEQFIAAQPERLHDVLPLLQDAEAPMQVRVGAGALLEGQAGSDQLAAIVPDLGALCGHKDHRIRGDACHYLSLTGSRDALSFLEPRLKDAYEEVREIARESIETLKASGLE